MGLFGPSKQFYMIDNLTAPKAKQLGSALKGLPSIRRFGFMVEESILEVEADRNVEDLVKNACFENGIGYRTKLNKKDLRRFNI